MIFEPQDGEIIPPQKNLNHYLVRREQVAHDGEECGAVCTQGVAHVGVQQVDLLE